VRSLDPGELDARPNSGVPTVATKLVVPPTPGYLIIRKRLLGALDAGVRCPRMLLSAPAGAGKTILLSSWIQTRQPPGPVAWLSLDEDDNDASRLAADMLSALRSGGVVRRGGALDRLSPPLGARTDAFLAAFVNGLAKLRGPFVLVLDDVHELTSPQAGAMLDFLVRHTPSQCRLVMAGRSDPPIPVERLRLDGTLAELRACDLAFERDEAAKLYRQLDVKLSEADVDALWRRTEGWAAALRLAGISLQGHPAPQQFVAEFAGTDRAVADYLVSEVLRHISAEHRAFMLRTCLVDSLSPELADALTGLQGSALTLSALERSGAPLAQTRPEGPWYRYHPLFGELLRAHLRHSHPEELPLLHRRAAGWYADHGQVRTAIRHALAGESWEQAGSLIEDNWLDLFISGASSAVRDPMGKLPADVIAAHPRLAIAFAGSRLENGDLDSAQRYLSLARHRIESEAEDEQVETALAAVALLQARLRVDVQEAKRHGRRLSKLARTPGQRRWPLLRSFALSNLGATLLWADRPHLATGHLQEALALAEEAGCEHTALDCYAQLAIVHLLHDRFTEAQEASGAAVAIAKLHGWEDGPAAACAYLAVGNVAYLRGEFERAHGLASRAVSAAQTAELPVKLAARVLQALTLTAAGPRSAAEGIVKLGSVTAAIADRRQIPRFLSVAVEDAAARVSTAAGRVEAARAMLEGASSRIPQCLELKVRKAEVELHGGAPSRARSMLAGALENRYPDDSEMPRHSVAQLEAWLLRALADQACGEHDAAAEELEHALDLAERERLYGPFLLHGRPAQDLLERHAQRGTAHPALLEALLDGIDRGSAHPRETTLGEPLTERELKILRYLPTMLSNAEIGAETFVSLNTVKTHLRSIYRKLDASSRADAVQRARTLGLLPHGIRRPRVARHT
jgi:LuxR family transcriptional regulator, maltose regulon positive regulatory protein